jgi:hypothetical protein
MKRISLDQLAEGISPRHVGAERQRLAEKWSKTGLLKGLEGQRRLDMSQLLENQAAQALRESVSLGAGGAGTASSGQIQGFTSIAFPIVRRVFGGLVANELVSIQPMSLPSGLIFYIDYTYGSNVGGDAGLGLSSTSTNNTYTRGQSIYNNPVGKGVQSGSLQAGGMYDLVGAGFSKVHKYATTVSASGLDVGAWTSPTNGWVALSAVRSDTSMTGSNGRFVSFDSQVQADAALGNLNYTFMHVPVANLVSQIPQADLLAVDQVALFGVTTASWAPQAWGQAYQAGNGVLNLRRHNKRGDWNSTTGIFTPNPMGGSHVQMVVRLANNGTVGSVGLLSMSVALTDQFSVVSQDGAQTGATLTVPTFESDFGTSPSPTIPDIDIKIESIAITATTRKLRARWSPELAQDLNAYQSLDAEVELTQILSEQIALEIDREILLDLLTSANGANLFWSRAPGKFVSKDTGAPVTLASSLAVGPQFTGTVREWYETLVETIIDCGNTIHRKTLRGSANFIVVGPDVATILEASVLYRPKVTLDGDGQVGNPFSIGCEPVGSLSNRFTVYKDPYFPRSKILVGYKGGNYMETGYVYAPYVPLIVTPTIFAPEDFTPRKGVMTRYGKKVIRSDFYGTVTCLDMGLI